MMGSSITIFWLIWFVPRALITRPWLSTKRVKINSTLLLKPNTPVDSLLTRCRLSSTSIGSYSCWLLWLLEYSAITGVWSIWSSRSDSSALRSAFCFHFSFCLHYSTKVWSLVEGATKMVLIFAVSSILGGLGAFVIGTLEEFLNYIFSKFISRLCWNIVPVLFKLFLNEHIPHGILGRHSRRCLFRNQHKTGTPHAHHVHFVDRLWTYFPLLQSALLRLRHDHRFHLWPAERRDQ